MKRSQMLASRLREVFLNGKWIANTNYQILISDITWHQAIKKIHDLNSIAALTFHVDYYLSGLLNVFDGGELEIRDKYSFEMPAINSERDWKKLKTEFLKNVELFAIKVETMSDDVLDSNFVKEEYGTFERNIEAVIEHSYYHMGQVSLIKKMVLNS